MSFAETKECILSSKTAYSVEREGLFLILWKAGVLCVVDMGFVGAEKWEEGGDGHVWKEPHRKKRGSAPAPAPWQWHWTADL